jgi:hypothetical protein
VYRSAFDDVFIGGGSFRNTLHSFGMETFKKWYQTRNEEFPYEINMARDADNNIVFTDNSYKNSMPDDPNATVYGIPADPSLINPNPGVNKDETKWVWKFPGNAPLVKVDTIPNKQ